MPQHKSAIKRVRQNEKRRARNRIQRSKMRTLTRKALDASEKSEAEKALKDAVSFLDKMAAKGIVHPNNAARKKARLTRHFNSL
ncbi:MAG: 30S ribosomal protein S20 [Balneolaceae bacterium]